MIDHKERCPNCNADLQGEPIPLEQQEKYGATHFGRKIGIYDSRTDRTVAYQCPDCGHQWDR